MMDSKIKSLTKLLAASLIVVSAAGCADEKFKPTANPHPKYYLIVKGHINQQLQKTMHLRLISTYVGTSSRCSFVTNPLAGLKENPARSISYSVNPNKNGAYTVKIPLDYYLAGKCNWTVWGVGYTLTDYDFKMEPSGYGLVSFDENKYQKYKEYNPKIFNFVCSNTNANSCQISVPKNDYADIYLDKEHSFQQTLNIVYKKKGK